ncbi:MAG TPA: ATPase domain-containing protein [Thermoanaerobaculia bacterium]|nr:ATPase domain-containing protein [Thermoanaerobaculia bacterium]
MERVSTGNRNLDAVLGGGLPRHSLNLVMGLPGTGKTVLAEQLAFANGSADRPVLYLTTFSEPLAKVLTYLQEFRFADPERIGTEIHYDSLVDVLLEDPTKLVERLRETIQSLRPSVLVIDSFKAILELVPDRLAWRKLAFDVAGLLAAYDVTSLWVGEYEPGSLAELPEFAIADGIIELHREQWGSRDERFLRVAKLRGSDFLDGRHAFTISAGGLRIFPRLVGPEGLPRFAGPPERLSTGVAGLDAMIESGWLRGSSTLVEGPSGAGKSILGLHFLRHGAAHGEPGLLVNFQESPAQVARAVTSLGWNPAELLRPGRLDHMYNSPVELQIDTIVQGVLSRVEEHGVRRVVIDALGDLERCAGDPRRFSDYIYALTQEFAVRQVTALLLMETPPGSPLGVGSVGGEVSYMTDNILLLSMELGEDLVRTVRIVKTRGSAHDGGRHVLRIGADGIRVE